MFNTESKIRCVWDHNVLATHLGRQWHDHNEVCTCFTRQSTVGQLHDIFPDRIRLRAFCYPQRLTGTPPKKGAIKLQNCRNWLWCVMSLIWFNYCFYHIITAVMFTLLTDVTAAIAMIMTNWHHRLLLLFQEYFQFMALRETRTQMKVPQRNSKSLRSISNCQLITEKVQGKSSLIAWESFAVINSHECCAAEAACTALQ